MVVIEWHLKTQFWQESDQRTEARSWLADVQHEFLLYSVPRVMSSTYWQRIDAHVEHQMIYSPERKKTHNVYTVSITSHSFYVIQLLIATIFTLLAADPPSSHPEWVLPNLSSFFPHLCWAPTDSFSWSEAGRAPHPPTSVDRFHEALDPGTCPFLCGHMHIWSVSLKMTWGLSI